jgi:catechol 2,3-dioxygenase-like lactoylglutathione lyase family enzyme
MATSTQTATTRLERIETQNGPRYDVGGVLLERPFRIRRLGHFGFNVVNMDAAYPFYTDLLGFRVSDVRDDGKRLTPEQRANLGNCNGYFMRYGGDHHAFVLYNKGARDLLDTTRAMRDGVTINQITWQVGSLAEVVNGHTWFVEQGQRMRRSGRDMPGSNWHTYLFDPDGHVNELYYGIEQIGWNGYSKPYAMHDRAFHETPPLPQMSEFEEIQQALARGVDLLSGYRHQEQLPAAYDVDGILLPRPFKIVRIGPVSLFVEDLEAARRFYEDALGFVLSEQVTFDGQTCLFLRASTEHHSVALYPIALREKLGLSPHTTSMAFGLQLATYRQLREAIAFLQSHGARTVELPPELHPGIQYAAHVLDPDGHCLQLYFAMEQLGWDARPRQTRQPAGPVASWPEQLDDQPEAYRGEPYLGPWG